jgi:hypothetical protein
MSHDDKGFVVVRGQVPTPGAIAFWSLSYSTAGEESKLP